MATSKEIIEYILDQMVGVGAGGVTARKMFGEYALYSGGRVVALVCDNTLFIKMTEQGREFTGKDIKEGIAYPGAKPSLLIDDEHIEDRDWLCELVRITALNVPAPKPKKPKKA